MAENRFPTPEKPLHRRHIVDLCCSNQQLWTLEGGKPAEFATLTAKRMSTVVDDFGRLCTGHTDSLCEPGVAHGGLLHAATHLLQQSGYEVCLHPHYRDLPVPEIDTLATKDTAYDPDMLKLVQWGQGIIRYDLRVKPEWLIAQIAIAWPNLSMAICTSTFVEARDLRFKLFRYKIKSTLVTSRCCPAQMKRIVIGTFSAMGHPDIASNKRDVMLFTNAAHAISIGNPVQCLLTQPDTRRIIGLLPAGRKLSPYDQDRLIATFGLNRCDIPAHGKRRTRPAVRWLDGMKNRTQKTDITKDPIRNRQIAKEAKTLHAAHGDAAGNCVIVLVKSVDQGIALAERLPDWPLVTETFDPGLLSHKQRRIYNRTRKLWNTGSYMIVTVAAAEPVDLPHGQCAVIWACGGEHPAPLPDTWLTVPYDSRRQIDVIDFDDRHRSSLQDTKRRRRAYRRQGWFETGQNAEEERIKQFLAARPRKATQ